MPSKNATALAKWERGSPLKRADNIVACQQFRHLKPFRPTYEQDRRTYVNWLLGWEYGRMWLEEHKKWEDKYFGSGVDLGIDFIKRNFKMTHVKKLTSK